MNIQLVEYGWMDGIDLLVDLLGSKEGYQLKISLCVSRDTSAGSVRECVGSDKREGG